MGSQPLNKAEHSEVKFGNEKKEKIKSWILWGELFFFVTDGSYLIIPFLFDAPETESIYMIRNAHFVHLDILESTLAVFLENPNWNSHQLNEQQPNAFICTTHSTILSQWSIL